MLFDLPSDLSLCILQDWLADLKCLAALDAASAPSVRSDYLGLVAQPAFVLSSTIVIDEKRSPKKMIFWISTRAIKLSSLESDAAMLKQCAKISYLSLRTVRKLKVFSKPFQDANAFDPEWFHRLLRLLPQLRAVDMSNFEPAANAGYVTMLSASALSLSEIKLDNSLTSCDGIIPLNTAFGPTLTVASFSSRRSINIHTLKLIASTCKMMRELFITCARKSSKDCVVSDSLPMLERLHMCCGHPLDEQAVAALFNHHPLLTDVDLKLCEISPMSCANIISIRPRVTHFACEGFRFARVIGSDSQQAQCQLAFEENKLDPYSSQEYLNCILQLASSCSSPFTCLECRGALLNNEDLLKVLSVLGKDLKTFITHLNRTGDDDRIVQQITLLCPRVEALALISTTTVTDASLKAIANNCKFISRLWLFDGKLLTDFGMCYLIGKVGEQLAGLHLIGCSLTSSSLVSILSFCSSLEMLEIRNTGISAKDIQTYLISSTQNRLPKLEKLLVNPAVFNLLMAFVTNPANAVDDMKWVRLIDVVK